MSTAVEDRVEARQPHPRRRVLRALVLVLVGALVIVGVWAVWFSSLLTVRQVRAVGIEGSVEPGVVERLSADVIAAAGVPVGVPLARIDTAAAERGVLALPWVATAEVRRGWPSEVVVAVTPRTPVAVVGGGVVREQGVDADGVVFEAAPAILRGLPRVTASGTALQEAVAVIGSLPPGLAKRVTSVTATTRDDVELTLRSGDIVRWGSAEQAALKSEVLGALMERKADVYDVSAPELPTTYRAP